MKDNPSLLPVFNALRESQDDEDDDEPSAMDELGKALGIKDDDDDDDED